MDTAEVEFLAEKETVTVVPNFAQDKIYLIGVRLKFLQIDTRPLPPPPSSAQPQIAN